MVRARVVLALVALFLLAPALAAVLIGTLLLVGVEPHLVFLPGHFVMARFAAFGFHPPKAVGVMSTVFVWWVVIISVWLILRRFLRRDVG